ncbi:hypothetical protein MHYP_G00132410 [Metynnis hypsauchen]
MLKFTVTQKFPPGSYLSSGTSSRLLYTPLKLQTHISSGRVSHKCRGRLGSLSSFRVSKRHTSHIHDTPAPPQQALSSLHSNWLQSGNSADIINWEVEVRPLLDKKRLCRRGLWWKAAKFYSLESKLGAPVLALSRFVHKVATQLLKIYNTYKQGEESISFSAVFRRHAELFHYHTAHLPHTYNMDNGAWNGTQQASSEDVGAEKVHPQRHRCSFQC